MPIADVLLTLEVEEVPGIPPDWTHKLVLQFYRLPWALPDLVLGAIERTLVPAINAFEWLLGYDYLGFEMNWTRWDITLYYKQRASPAIPIAAIFWAIVTILAGVGIIILSLTWYERERRITYTRATKLKLLEEGKLTQEEYEELIEAEKDEPAPWEKVVSFGIIILILFIIFVFLRGRRRGRD